MIKLITFILLTSSLSLRAATINAISTSWVDVSNAVNTAVNDDIVTIPAGASAWAGTLEVAKGITIIGAGRTQTFITNNSASYAMHIVLQANKTNRVSSINCVGGSSLTFFFYIEGSNLDTRRFRIDYCKSTEAGPAGLMKIDTVLGVADHNYIFGQAPGNEFAHIKFSTWNGLLKGNGVWTNETPLFGTENFFFFEDNILENTNQTFIVGAVDAQAGARYVWRNNTNCGFYVEGHGSEASYERSTHAVEIYNNYFWMSNLNQIVTFFRGGCGLIWSNNVNDITANTGFHLEHNRMNDHLFTPFGGADGRNHWDTNSTANPLQTGTASSAGTTNVVVSGAGWTPNVYVGNVIRATSGTTVSSMTRSGTIVTVNATAHGYVNNDYASIFGADQQEYNGTWLVTRITDNQFTFDTAGSAPTTPATGTIKTRAKNYFSEIVGNSSDTIIYHHSVYGSPLTMVLSAGDTFEINKVTHGMDQIGRIGGSLIDDSATPAFPSGWNNQTTYPWRAWNNNLGNASPVLSPSSGTIVNNIHYIEGTPLPGYGPYQYPHGMVSGVILQTSTNGVRGKKIGRIKRL